MAPEGSKVSSLSASAERCTVSRQRPVYVQPASHRRQYSTVRRNTSSEDSWLCTWPEQSLGAPSYRLKTADCPSCRVRLEATPRPSTTFSGTGEDSVSFSRSVRKLAPPAMRRVSCASRP